jgi:hypothetical protein
MWATSLILKKLNKVCRYVNYQPMGETSPNLVTLEIATPNIPRPFLSSL